MFNFCHICNYNFFLKLNTFFIIDLTNIVEENIAESSKFDIQLLF